MNYNGVHGCLCDSGLLMSFYRAQMLCALKVCLFVSHFLHPWDQLPCWNITVLSVAMLLMILFFFFSFKEEDTQLYFPWMLINVLPDGQEWKPFHSGRFRDNPESTTNSSESLDRRESLSLAALVCWSTYQVQASRYDYRDSSGSLCVAELLSKDLRLTPIYCPINLPPLRYRFHSQRYHVLFNYDTC